MIYAVGMHTIIVVASQTSTGRCCGAAIRSCAGRTLIRQSSCASTTHVSAGSAGSGY